MIGRIDNMMTGWSTALQRSPLFLISLCLPWLVLLGWLAAVAWFLCDDAFISFRYVRNLLEGHGLVFNPGEYVEGYTNFLWVLELAAIWRLSGIPPEQAAPWLAAPFAALVAAHYLFRYGYYGERLPNTYYAKYVRPWYESGFRYLWAATLETGLYLLLPLAAVAMRHRWRLHRDGAFALVLLLVGVHMIYVMRIGGDHFEYRPLDFYWPLLAVPAALGIVHLGSRLAARRWRPSALGRIGARTLAVVLFVPVLFYTSAIQGTLLFAGAGIRERISNLYIELDHDNAGWLLVAPAMPMLVAISNDLRRLAAPQLVASPFAEHREFARKQLRNWKPYENMQRDVIPDDALMFDGVIGIRFYYLPDLKVIDRYGLVDATVARNPVTRPNRERVIAHDRWPPPGYFEERGVNFTIRPPESSASAALASARYAVKVGADLWMPFDSPDKQWVLERFGDRDLRMREENAPRLRPPGLEPVIRSNFDVYFTGKSLQAGDRKAAP